MLRWNSETNGNSILPQSETKLYPPRWQHSVPQSRVHHHHSPDLNPTKHISLGGWRLGWCPTGVCDQHEEKVPGCCSCVRFFFLFVLFLQISIIQSTKQHQTRKKSWVHPTQNSLYVRASFFVCLLIFGLTKKSFLCKNAKWGCILGCSILSMFILYTDLYF